MPSAITPWRLKDLLDAATNLALIDIREHAEYNAAHIPGASSLPRRLIESRLTRLVPCHSVQIVVYDDDGQRATLAAGTMERMGYARVAILQAGLKRWASLGFATEWGMNVPSKDFGERVEAEQDVPTISVHELDRRMKRGERLIILDTRTPEEYRQYSIPGSRSLPGGELPLRVNDIVRENGDATLVVNCAGRTRSIIGTRTLQRMGLANSMSLTNGTSGWTLAGLELEQGADRVDLPAPSPWGRAAAEAYADRLAAEDGVRFVSVNELRTTIDNLRFSPLLGQRDGGIRAEAADECVYLVDVRTEAEYATGHIPGFWWFPGGQAVQRADDLVAVKNAKIIFCCDGRSRSTVTASWFRQMGYPNVYAVDGGTTAWEANHWRLTEGPEQQVPFGLEEASARARWLSPEELRSTLDQPERPAVVFVDTSREFANGHVPGARWLSRSWLELRIRDLVSEPEGPVVVTDSGGQSSPLAAETLSELGYRNVSILRDGLVGWRCAGLPVEQGLSGIMSLPEDVVPTGPERSPAEMIEYLRWEEALGHKYRA